MDIKSLRYFLEVAREGNITRAAEKLCIAQPPLSRQLQKLEEELGVQLLIRGKRRVELTEEGKFLKQQAEEIVALVERTEYQLGMFKSSTYGSISIAVTESCGAGVMCALIERFHEKYPNIRFRILAGSGDEVNQRMEQNLADIGIMREPFDMERYDREFLKSEPWIAVMGKNSTLAKETGKNIPLAMLSSEALIIPSRVPIQEEINSWFNDMARERNIFCIYNSPAAVIPLVESGTAVAICPESVKSVIGGRKLVYKRIVEPNKDSSIYLVKKRRQMMPLAAQLFWEFAREYREGGD